MLRRFLIPVLLITGVAGCGSNNASSSPKPTSTPAPVQTRPYHDARFNFSFRYPVTWKAPAHGSIEQTPSGPAYVIRLVLPGNGASGEVEVIPGAAPLPNFPNGRVAKDPSGGPDTFHYFHATVSGRRAMRVQRWSGKVVDGEDTYVNVGTKQFGIRLVTGTPPFSAAQLQGYHIIVSSMRLPFS